MLRRLQRGGERPMMIHELVSRNAVDDRLANAIVVGLELLPGVDGANADEMSGAQDRQRVKLVHLEDRRAAGHGQAQWPTEDGEQLKEPPSTFRQGAQAGANEGVEVDARPRRVRVGERAAGAQVDRVAREFLDQKWVPARLTHDRLGTHSGVSALVHELEDERVRFVVRKLRDLDLPRFDAPPDLRVLEQGPELDAVRFLRPIDGHKKHGRRIGWPEERDEQRRRVRIAPLEIVD